MTPRLRLAGIVIALVAIFASPVLARAEISPWDDATTGAIMAAIQKTPALSGSTITVDCFSGIVMLTGKVTNFELRDTVEQTVRQIPGISRIINELNQDANRNPTEIQRDAVIQSTLDMTLAQYAAGTPAVVIARGHVYDGIVYLLGAVSDPSMNDILQSSIMALPGVHAVVAHLAIQQKPPAAVAAMPPPEAIAALPQAFARAHKQMRVRTRAIDQGAEDETAARIARAAPVAALGRDYSVQLASEPDETAAAVAWKRKKSANADLLGDLAPTVTRADLGAKGIRFRLKAGPLPDLAAAAGLCADLGKRHVPCMVVRNEVASGVATRPMPVAKVETPALPVPPPVRKQKIAVTTTPEVASLAAPEPVKRSEPAPRKSAHAAPFYVQLASRSSEAAARDYWATQRRAHGELFDGLSSIVTPADLGPKGIMYRLKAGPLADRAAAAALCAQLARHQLDCLVVRDIAARPAP